MPVTITHSTLADGTFSATGAAAWDATHTVSGLGTMAEQNSNNVNITGGSITGVTGVLSSLTVNSTPTSGGAAGQIMFDTGSVLQESSNLVWDNTNKKLTLTADANPVIPTLRIAGGSGITGTALTNVVITGIAGQFSCDAATLEVGQLVSISGTFGGTGSITGYTNPTTYLISSTNGSTTFTLVTSQNAAIVTSVGTPTGLTYTVTAPTVNISQTWNNSNVAFSGFRLNITDTNSAVSTSSSIGSLFFDVQRNGRTLFGLGKDTPANNIAYLYFGNNGFSSGPANNTNYVLANNQTNINLNSPGGILRFSISNNSYLAMSSTQIRSGLNFAFTTDINSNGDTILSRRGAANLRLGAADAAAPVAQTLSVQSVVAGTTNTAGANLTITGSQGTGNANGGSINFQVAPFGSSGTAQNALTTALTIAANPSISGSYYAAIGTPSSTVLAAVSSNSAGMFISNSAQPIFYLENTGAYSSTGGSGVVLLANAGSAITSGSRMGQFLFGAASASNALRNTAIVQAFATQNWVDASAYGTRIEIATTANGSTTRTTRLIIGNGGIITLGATEANTVPALKPSSTILQVRLGDDSAYAPVEASTVRTAVAYTVATLPAAGTAGRRAYVTDATAPTWLGALTGGGAVVTPVFDNGTAWVAG
jgi:hypothetical protein